MGVLNKIYFSQRIKSLYRTISCHNNGTIFQCTGKAICGKSSESPVSTYAKNKPLLW